MPSNEPAQTLATGPTAVKAQWLAIVGIGEDGIVGLGERARTLIGEAEWVFGGERHLALAAPLITGTAQAWPKPFDAAVEAVRRLCGRPVCVLASGDPFMHGVGVTLSRYVAAEEMEVLPAPSAFSLAASRLGWALQDTECVSLHGKPVELLRPFLHPGRKLLVLTSDENGPAAVATLLAAHGFGASRVTVLEALGGTAEKLSHFRADALAGTFHPLNLLAITVAGSAEADVIPLTSSLPEKSFRHDGQITKRAIRALTLSALAPRRGELLWDIGAGSGSIAIEWMLRDRSLRAIAIEPRADRAANIRENARRLGVPGIDLREARAPEALDGLPAPDAVFIGGGGSVDGVLDAAIALLKPGGRLVANAVTLEMEALLLREHATRGGELVRLAVARAEGVGGMTGWRPAMPVTQWAWVKPAEVRP